MRLDAALAARGLARSRTHAARLVAAGSVIVNGRSVGKPSHPVADADELALARIDRYVSRAAHKLLAALDASPDLMVQGRLALDVGASTGGFSQVLLERGAAPVIALDVGHDQLDRSLRGRDDLLVVEGVNARDLTPDSLRGLTGIADRPSLVVGDLSFISLRTVLPALIATADPDADFVLLIKPQFEVGRGNVKEGIVHNPGLREDAVANVAWAAWDLGLGTVMLLPSPIAGTNGNHEYLIRLSRSRGVNPTEWVDRIATMTRGS